MGILILIVPLVIYYFILKAVLKNYDETKRRFKKRTVFILLLTLPFWDHIIGYTVYKYLCFTSGGVKIYKTVTNEQEQRDYWFYEGLNSTEYHGSDKMYKYLSSNGLVKRNGPCLKPIKKDNYSICAKDGFKEVYLNYCSLKYDTLTETDSNYKNSCTNANKIIKKYNLKNVISVPKSPYGTYISTFAKSYNHQVIPFLQVSKSINMIKNYETDEVLAIHNQYSIGHGWYIDLFSPYRFKIFRCHKSRMLIGQLKEAVIPNPYKTKK